MGAEVVVDKRGEILGKLCGTVDAGVWGADRAGPKGFGMGIDDLIFRMGTMIPAGDTRCIVVGRNMSLAGGLGHMGQVH